MTSLTLLRQSLRFYWREHTLTALATAVAAAVLTGALVVGDSLKAALAGIAADRIGSVKAALDAGERLFDARLAEVLRQRLAPCEVAGVLALSGTVENEDGTARAGRVQVLGVDPVFGRLVRRPRGPEWEGGVFINAALARRLGVQSGDEILVRVEKPGRVSRDMALAAGGETAVALRERVRGVLADDAGGRFSLRNVHVSPLNVYVPLAQLQALADAGGQLNMLLCGPGAPAETELDGGLKSLWRPADVGLHVWDVPERDTVELRSRQVFLDDVIVKAAAAIQPRGTESLVYMVNALRHDRRSTPYSFVCGTSEAVADGLADNEMAVTDWLADDLGLATGATVRVEYYVLGAAQTLAETSAAFRVSRIIPLAMAGDPTLMPDIPGVSETGNCRDWRSGLPIDLTAIRSKDEAYWDRWRGAPKAFVNLRVARTLWATPWGDTTAVRWASPENSAPAVERALKDHLDPSLFGLSFRDATAEARRSVDAALDFRQLFVGLSFFLVVAALMLVAMLYRLTLERREAQAGLLMSVGATGPLLRWLTAEGAAVSVAGAILGIGGGLAYAQAMLAGLGGAWQPAVGGMQVRLALRTGTLVMSATITVALAVATMAAGLGALRRRTPHALLSGTRDEPGGGRRGWGAVALAALVGAVLLLGWAWTMSERERVGLFFGVGGLLLLAGCAGFGWRLRRGTGLARPPRSLWALALGEAGRQPLRGVLVAGLMATVSFLLATLALYDPPEASRYERASGTGGFAWWAESAIPVHSDLNTAAGRRRYGLAGEDLAGVSVVGLRVHRADDASCLNLARAQRPQIVGVEARALGSRGAFRFVRTASRSHPDPAEGWAELVREAGAPDVVPAVADEATLVWGLGLGVGDELAAVDGRGRPFRLRFVGMIEPSVLQGSVLIDARAFEERYPGGSGFTGFLVDAPPDQAEAVRRTLVESLRREGLWCESTVDRMGEFGAVTAAYLAMFRTLGAFGLLLGVAGLAVVLARNVVERRGPLALLQAVGFRRGQVAGLLVAEQAWILGVGLGGGLAAAWVATWPSWSGAPEAGQAGLTLGWALLVLGCGLGATAVTARVALRRVPWDGLRAE